VQSELPKPSPEFVVMGAVLALMERLHPGFVDHLREQVASEAARSAVIRLRGPKHAPEVIEATEQAEAWVEAASLVVDAVAHKKKRRA
jgi:hypothetical protein